MPTAASRGRGEPLTAGSWLNRPYYVGGFIGGIGGDTLVADEINSNGGFFWGGNIGWDYDPYWGLEMRLAFSNQGLDYFANPAFDNAYNELILWDTSFVYYPWGDRAGGRIQTRLWVCRLRLTSRDGHSPQRNGLRDAHSASA